MKKRYRKQKYIDYDYESAYKLQLERLDEENEKRMREEGKTRNIYATKEIRAGDRLEVEIYPEFTKGQQREIPDNRKREKQRKAQKKLNDKNSRKTCERLVEANFTDADIWATFTYTDKAMPASMEAAKGNMQKYIRRLNYRRKKEGLPNAKYIFVTECSDKGRWHHHIIMDGALDMDTVEKLWTSGRRNQVRRLHRDEDGLTGMAKYITKEKKKRGKHQKCWQSSKGLIKPKEVVNHYKTKQKDVDKIVTGKITVAQHLEKWYAKDGYEFAESEVRYNTFNGRYYIYGRMRKKQRSYRKGTKENEYEVCTKKRRHGADHSHELGEVSGERAPGIKIVPPHPKRRE